MSKQHPEGLEYEPRGHGFTGTVEPGFSAPLLLLTRRNIEAARRNHGDEWFVARSELPPRTRDKRTGRFSGGFTDDEADRLATLATFVTHGLFTDDRLVTIEDRRPPIADAPIVCDCDECDGECAEEDA